MIIVVLAFSSFFHVIRELSHADTACADQVSLLQWDSADSDFGPSALQQCDDILKTADHFEDIHLQALANSIRASIMEQKG